MRASDRCLKLAWISAAVAAMLNRGKSHDVSQTRTLVGEARKNAGTRNLTRMLLELYGESQHGLPLLVMTAKSCMCDAVAKMNDILLSEKAHSTSDDPSQLHE